MAKKLMSWKTKGMNRDLSVSAFNPEFAFENRNLRLGTNDANTMMSWVNEKGTMRISIVRGNWISGNDSTRTTVTEIIGTPIGTAVINHQLVVFTTDTLHDLDYIYVLKYADTSKTQMLCKMLFGGDNLSLGFKVDHPLETLVSYESEMVQKVYWTDGINQPRVINIEGNIRRSNNTQFDFVPTLQLQEDVTVKKILGASGTFAPGVIQYAFTYYTKYGQESNIFYTSPLLYISYRDRGASPEDKVDNAFQITITGIDANFDYVRIYSIQRTSYNATPICKRIQDIAIDGLSYAEGTDKLTASYIDTGTSGNSIDPTELLYVGGEFISAETMEQKDNTLFFGNISISRPQITADFGEVIRNHSKELIEQTTRSFQATSVSTGSYVYSSQLSSTSVDGTRSVPCAGFKAGETYRLGVQFQHKSGKWSDPVWIADKVVENIPSLNADNTQIILPTLRGNIVPADANVLVGKGYIRARAVVVFPQVQDRTIICQGIVNPTLFTQEHRNNGDLYAQASWFFRGSYGRKINSSNCTCSPANKETLPYTHYGIGAGIPDSGCYNYNPSDIIGSEQNPNAIRLVEIQGDYDDRNKFKIERTTVTFNSPDVEFDTQLSLTDYSSSKYRQVGYSQFGGTMSDIDIQTESATISNMGTGFVHKSFSDIGTYGIISGLFYDDFIVDDDTDKDMVKLSNEYSPCKWMVHLWNKSGSLNNDISRPLDKGTQSAKLKQKIISNLRYANTHYDDNFYNEDSRISNYVNFPQVFSSKEVQILKLNKDIYMGNIDTAIMPDRPDGNYFAFDGLSIVTGKTTATTVFTSNKWWKTFNKNPEVKDHEGLYKYGISGWFVPADHDIIGDKYLDIAIKKGAVRMKYKSTPHLVFSPSGTIDWFDGESTKANSLPVVELIQEPIQRFGGTSIDAFKENVWIPAGEPTTLDTTGNTPIFWEYGDTYFQRWDCLKTYAFTKEDVNQVVEIGSFMLETRVNIDGRYDKNRGQMNNLYMSPENFNLINPVYSQPNNFFQYRIQDKFYYEDTVFPNQITWAKTKTSGADVDAWTNVTLASTLELDGDKGQITSLQKYNNQLVCFQDSSLSRISYNETYQITTTEGVPVEVANSGKVQGKIYISDTVGCSNKWSIVNGTMGLYFMDSNGKGIYLFNGQMTNLSESMGFSAWSKMHIPANGVHWTPIFPTVNEQSAFVAYYDRLNQEVLFINHDLCLAYSEKFGAFTSFYDYQTTPFFNNLDDTGIWLRANQLWKHHAGDYCRFFGTLRPYSMVLVGNPEPQLDKTFTNIEFRACVDGDGTASGSDFTPYLPFDSLDTWNEYQHGIAYLNNMRYPWKAQHHTSDNEASLIRKFRIWRCDIPRDNGDVVDTFDETFDDTFHSIARTSRHPLDRMRNPWLYLRLRKDEQDSNRRAEIHDIIMTYFT